MTHTTSAVSFDNRDIGRYQTGERRMAMRGFEQEYPDIVDYIIRITHRIWEEKAVGYIYDTYQHNCIIHGSGGDRHGREGVVQASLQSMAAFPDARIYGNDVVWTGNETDGFHTSHLITETGTNTGYTSFGPPTGRRMNARCIAHCLSRDNKIFEEWILYDEPATIRQLGYDIHSVVAHEVQAMLEHGKQPTPAADSARMVGQHAPQPWPASNTDGGFDVDDFIRSSYHEIWNRRMLNVIPKRYARGHVASTTGDRTFHGPGELAAWNLNLLAMFPDADVHVEQVYWNGDDANGYRVAVLWWLVGTHMGHGPYGPPSGARARVMCLSQHRIKNGMFEQEFSLFDEMEILRQIALRRLQS